MPLEERGRAFVATALCMWDYPAKAEILGSIIHAASCELFALERLREVFSSLALQAVSASLPDDEVGRRADLVATQLVGPAMT
ncbi:hypothetical protein AB0C76_02055 [Kitasatospora sp. NPDC048722]|uniref:TetR/AcrR family transcriptional regulator n=1 Tax=Kitasatospora sp. NPDC048722 TaxID=3155639 RepID=UPI0033EE0F39